MEDRAAAAIVTGVAPATAGAARLVPSEAGKLVLSETGKLNVFISYSRADIGFADELDAGLQVMGFATSLDRHSIVEGEDWKKRLGGLIADSDTVVFVLSPDLSSADARGKRDKGLGNGSLRNRQRPTPLSDVCQG